MTTTGGRSFTPRAERSAAPDPRHALGALGERLAAEHLQRRGFRVLARNVRSRRGEIDLIAFDGRTLVFVEVKTRCAVSGRLDRAAEPPLARLDGRQRARIRRLAAAWLCERVRERPYASELRLDAVGVVVDRAGRLLALDHVEGGW